MTLLGDGSQGLRPLALRPGRPPSMAHAPTSCRAAQTWSFPGPEAHGGSGGRTYRDPPPLPLLARDPPVTAAGARQSPLCRPAPQRLSGLGGMDPTHVPHSAASLGPGSEQSTNNALPLASSVCAIKPVHKHFRNVNTISKKIHKF